MTKLEIRLRELLKELLPHVSASYQERIRDTLRLKRGNSIGPEQVKRLYKAGWSMRRIADECDCSLDGVSKLLKREGVQARKGRGHGSKNRLTAQ